MLEADMTAMQYQTSPPDPWYYAPGGSPELFTELDDDPVELSFHGAAAQLLVNTPGKIPEGCELVYKYHAMDEAPEVVIERTQRPQEGRNSHARGRVS